MREGSLFILLLMVLVGCSEPNPVDESTFMNDEDLLTLVQERTFQYFWEGAEPNSGMARERYHLDDPDLDRTVVTSGGTGFGLMAIIVAMDRGFISQEAGIERIQTIADFLARSDRFHGVWPHWLDGTTGKVKPFSPKDDGGDLVETAFLAQGLLCTRQYLKDRDPVLAQQLDQLWREIEWDFYRGEHEENVLFWHWSPNFGWEMNFRIRGYNEALIAYVLAAASPTFSVKPEVYHEGWADNGGIIEKDPIKPLMLFHQGDEPMGGPLFWAHYSYLGLDPRNLADAYANFWEHNSTHARLNYRHCVANPGNFEGYGPNCWGLTASYSVNFYEAHSPKRDVGVISPTAALASFPYTPNESMAALRFFYEELGDRIWGSYGFYDAFSIHHEWYPQRYLAIDQGPIVVMIENYRTGLLWDLFMSCEEVEMGLISLGFQY